MTGTLTITAQAVARELAPRAPTLVHGSVDTRPRPAEPAQAGREAVIDAPHPIDLDRLEAARLKALVGDPGLRVSIRPDEASGRIVMQVVSRSTGEVVDQIPAEELLRLYSALREPLLDERA